MARKSVLHTPIDEAKFTKAKKLPSHHKYIMNGKQHGNGILHQC
jgi:hypothetical protein